MMAILTPTKETGSTARETDVVYVEPEQVVSDAELARLDVDGIAGASLADFLSAVLTHERCGTHLYRAAAARTQSASLRARYEEFGEETLHHVEVLEELVTTIAGNPSYVSAAARAVEAADNMALQSTFLLSGGVDPVVAEKAILDTVFLAETVDHANWDALSQLAMQIPEGELRDALQSAVQDVQPDEEEHLRWARDTRAGLTMAVLFGPPGAKLPEDTIARAASGNGSRGRSGDTSADDLEARSKDELYQQAQELEIEGRGRMTKAELLVAIRRVNG
jgi:rubrerythrin